MSFLFSLLDVVLIAILIIDTLGLVYEYRKNSYKYSDDYIRIIFSWVLFILICSILSCNFKGFFGTLLRLLIFGLKVFVTIPKLGGTLKIYNVLIDKGLLESYYKKIKEFIKTKVPKAKETLAQTIGESAESFVSNVEGATKSFANTVGETAQTLSERIGETVPPSM